MTTNGDIKQRITITDETSSVLVEMAQAYKEVTQSAEAFLQVQSELGKLLRSGALPSRNDMQIASGKFGVISQATQGYPSDAPGHMPYGTRLGAVEPATMMQQANASTMEATSCRCACMAEKGGGNAAIAPVDKKINTMDTWAKNSIISEIGKMFGETKLGKALAPANEVFKNFSKKVNSSLFPVKDSADKNLSPLGNIARTAFARVGLAVKGGLKSVSDGAKDFFKGGGGGGVGGGGGGFSSISGAMSGILGPLALVTGGAKGIDGLIKAADAQTKSVIQISQLSDEQRNNLSAQQVRGFSTKYANRIGVDSQKFMGQTTDLMKGTDAFGSIGEAMNFNELLQKSWKTSGLDDAAADTMSELIKTGLQRGFSGREIKTAMKNNADLGRAIAETMGVGVDKLQTLADKGKVTPQIIKDAFVNSAASINENFSKMPVTFEQAFARIKNNAVQAFEPIIARVASLASHPAVEAFTKFFTDKMVDLADTIGEVFDFVQGAIEEILPFITDVVKPIKRVIDNIWSAFEKVFGAVKKFFADTSVSDKTTSGWQKFLGVLESTADFLGSTFDRVANIVISLVDTISGFFTSQQDGVEGAKDLWESLAGTVERILVPLKRFLTTVIDTFEKIINRVGALFMKDSEFTSSAASGWSTLEDVFDNVVTVLEKIIEFTGELATYMMYFIKEAIEGIQKLSDVLTGFKNDIRSATEAVKEFLGFETVSKHVKMELPDSMKMALETSIDKKFIDAAMLLESAASELSGAVQSAMEAAVEDEDTIVAGNSPVNPMYNKPVGPMKIDKESMQLIRDLANVEVINRINNIQPTVNANFGDVHQSADVDKMLDRLETQFNSARSANLMLKTGLNYVR